MALMIDEEIINRVTQSTSNDVEENEEGEVEEVDQEMQEPKIEDVRRALETLQFCCLFQNSGNEMQKEVADIEKR